jgi:hypothetical protein
VKLRESATATKALTCENSKLLLLFYNLLDLLSVN